jgi:hypothetical protein
MSTTGFYNFNQVEEKLKQTLSQTNLQDNLAKSADAIAKLIEAILKTEGADGWASTIQPPLFTKEEAPLFEEALTPFTNLILSISKGEPISINQKSVMVGGALKGPDDIFQSIIEKNAEWTKATQDFARNSEFGILHLEHDYDTAGEDAAILRPLALIPTPVTEALSTVKVPIRLIVTVSYYILDIVRLILTTAYDFPNVRKILSIVLAIIDFLRGDWKKAILSFSGFFGKNQMLAGITGKLILSTFDIIAPDLRKRMIYGSIEVIKSLIIGSAIGIFKITAPAALREQVNNALTTFAEEIQQTDDALEQANEEPLPDFYEPSFDNLQNIQSYIKYKGCTSSVQKAILVLKQSALLRIALQLLRIPTDDKTLAAQCGNPSTNAEAVLNISREEASISSPSPQPSPSPPQSQPQQDGEQTSSIPLETPRNSLQPPQLEAPFGR